jgi:hypothetical protein
MCVSTQLRTSLVLGIVGRVFFPFFSLYVLFPGYNFVNICVCMDMPKFYHPVPVRLAKT